MGLWAVEHMVETRAMEVWKVEERRAETRAVEVETLEEQRVAAEMASGLKVATEVMEEVAKEEVVTAAGLMEEAVMVAELVAAELMVVGEMDAAVESMAAKVMVLMARVKGVAREDEATLLAVMMVVQAMLAGEAVKEMGAAVDMEAADMALTAMVAAEAAEPELMVVGEMDTAVKVAASVARVRVVVILVDEVAHLADPHA